jgi:hypothetical protein
MECRKNTCEEAIWSAAALLLLFRLLPTDKCLGGFNEGKRDRITKNAGRRW